MLSCSPTKIMEDSSVISNLAVTTCIKIIPEQIFFLSESLNGNKVLSRYLDLKITFSLQYDEYLSLVCFSLVLNQMKSYLNIMNQKLTPF